MANIAAGSGVYDILAPKQEQEEKDAQQKQQGVDEQDTLAQRLADNQQLAWNELRRHNRDAETIQWEESGNPLVRAGLTLQLTGYGIADGIYLIDRCTHKLGAGGSGYTTSGEAHKRLIGYGGGGTGTGSATGTGGGGNPDGLNRLN